MKIISNLSYMPVLMKQRQRQEETEHDLVVVPVKPSTHLTNKDESNDDDEDDQTMDLTDTTCNSSFGSTLQSSGHNSHSTLQSSSCVFQNGGGGSNSAYDSRGGSQSQFLPQAIITPPTTTVGSSKDQQHGLLVLEDSSGRSNSSQGSRLSNESLQEESGFIGIGLVAVEEDYVEQEKGLVTNDRATPSSTSPAPPATPSVVNRSVRFGTIHIHEHVVDMGGAVPSSGAPLTLASEPAQTSYEFDVAEYEDMRVAPPRKGREMLLTSRQRTDRLLALGYTMTEIGRCMKEAELVRQQRAKAAREPVVAVWWRNLKSMAKNRRNGGKKQSAQSLMLQALDNDGEWPFPNERLQRSRSVANVPGMMAKTT